MEILVAIILVLLLAALGLLLRYRRSSNRNRIVRGSSSEFIALKKICPLCSGMLEQGNSVHSTLFPGKESDLMHIFGCKYCWSGKRTLISSPVPRKPDKSSAHQKNSRRLRRCPCCHSILPEEGYLMARVFQKPSRRPHVHVYGCTICKPSMRIT